LAIELSLANELGFESENHGAHLTNRIMAQQGALDDRQVRCVDKYHHPILMLAMDSFSRLQCREAWCHLPSELLQEPSIRQVWGLENSPVAL